MTSDNEHYLKGELYDLVRTDPSIFEFLQAGSLDGIWYWDLEDMEQEWLSPRFKSVFGYTDDEMPNTPEWWQRNIHPDDLVLALDNFNKHKEDPNHPYDQIVRYKHKDGSTVWVRCRGLIIRDEQDNPVRMLGAHTNVTEIMELRHQAEVARDELKQANSELARMNKQKDRFFEIIAHDLKTPFSTLMGFSDMLVQNADNMEAEKIHEYGLLINRAADEAFKLLEDLLEWSRLKLERMEYSPLEFDVADVGRSNILRYEAIAEAKNIDLVINLDQALVAHADPRMVETVFRNLLSNAIKFTRTGGVVQVSGIDTGKHVEVSVTDNGIGMSDKRVSTLFDVSFKSSTTGTAGETGTGLGLTLCDEMIKQQGGDLKVLSTEGEGSTFTFSLPKFSIPGEGGMPS